MKLLRPSRRLFLARAALAAPALITCPKLLEAGWQSRDSNYNQNIVSGGGGLGLQTNCTAFWEFETTGWVDATGNGTTLTPTAAPGTTTGKVGNAVGLNGSTQFLSAASNTNVSAGGGSFSAAVWANLSSATSVNMIFSKSANSFGNFEWGFGTRFTSANVWTFRCTNTSTTHFQADDTVGIATGSFVHLVGTYDSGTKILTLYKNGSSVGTNTLTGTLNSSASATINVGEEGGASPILVSSAMDQSGFWKGRVLSAADVTALYNAGSGLSWAAML